MLKFLFSINNTGALLFSVLFACLFFMSASTRADSVPDATAAARMARYNVVWNSPSKDASGVMPLGNGDVAAGVYVLENGDLYLLLAKNDAYNYMGDIFKTGRVRIALNPNPFTAGKPFRQTLDLPTGSIRIEADGVKLRIWADARRPLFHVEVDSPHDITVTARPDLWKRIDHIYVNSSSGYTVTGGGSPGAEPPQDVRLDRNGRILWYFPVGDRSIYADDLKYYAVEHMQSRFPDPFRFNTFGNLLECPQLGLAGGKLTGTGKTFDIRIHGLTMQTPEPARWISAIEKQATPALDVTKDWNDHCRWWADFWNRSWIIVSDNTLPEDEREKFLGEPGGIDGRREERDGGALVAQSYNVFRFLTACQSRGRVQMKFNGGLFTQQLRVKPGGAWKRPEATLQPDGLLLTHEDDRLWGRRFTYQNQRLLYWPLLASGDYDLMKPFFDYYANLLGMRAAITKAWFGHDGAYYRENIEPTGGERDCGNSGRPPKTKPGEKYGGWYHDYYFTSGLETTAMMIDYVAYTGDTAFRDHTLVPFAREILLFFDKHYQRDAGGKLRMDPAQVLETWWNAVNPAPDVAGLRFCLDGLLAMKAGTADDQARWHAFRAEIPEVAMQTLEGRQAIAPAEKWHKHSNAENGELYPVFPFRCFGLGLGSADVVEWTMKHRTCKDAYCDACWTQDQIHWAYAGRANEARDGLVKRFRTASTMCRFPLYGREGPDSCPDFDHFGSGSVALQRMLIQEGKDGKILLLPAWPANWDADFKLHLNGGGTLTGTVKDGKLLTWDIAPADRRRDVVVGTPAIAVFPPVIPVNNLPLHTGCDSNGQNVFKGTIGRVTLFRGPLSSSDILALAQGDRMKPIHGAKVVASVVTPKAGDILPTQAADWTGPVSFEAWIQPADKESGRIFDKLTAGANDGILLDTFPELGLRLIVGSRTVEFSKVLKAGTWHHVAIVAAQDYLNVFLDGQSLSDRGRGDDHR